MVVEAVVCCAMLCVVFMCREDYGSDEVAFSHLESGTVDLDRYEPIVDPLDIHSMVKCKERGSLSWYIIPMHPYRYRLGNCETVG